MERTFGRELKDFLKRVLTISVFLIMTLQLKPDFLTALTAYMENNREVNPEDAEYEKFLENASVGIHFK